MQVAPAVPLYKSTPSQSVILIRHYILVDDQKTLAIPIDHHQFHAKSNTCPYAWGSWAVFLACGDRSRGPSCYPPHASDTAPPSAIAVSNKTAAAPPLNLLIHYCTRALQELKTAQTDRDFLCPCKPKITNREGESKTCSWSQRPVKGTS
jgi:hypothetical protein